MLPAVPANLDRHGLFEKFDSLIDEPLFADLYQRYADAAGFPEFRPVLDQLGIIVAGQESQTMPSSPKFDSLTARYTGEPGK